MVAVLKMAAKNIQYSRDYQNYSNSKIRLKNKWKNIFEETYLKDIKEKNRVINDGELEEFLDFLASSIGSLTIPQRLSNSFDNIKHVKIYAQTIKNYVDYFAD